MSHFCVYVFHDKDTDVGELLARYDENISVKPYVTFTKQEAIASVRDEIERIKRESYDEYLKDPIDYESKCNNTTHMEFIKNEFPKMLNWTDEECYEDKAKYYREDGLVDEDGNLLSTYNPDSKWDWWVIGGRWDGCVPNGLPMGEHDRDEIDTPFAFVTPDGEWVERGKMGWFGISTDEMDCDEWDKQFKEYLNTVPDDIILTQVDCHI